MTPQEITCVLVLKEFAEFTRRAGRSEFIEVFGERMGTHLWSELVNRYSRDMSALLCVLDNENMDMLARHLVKKGDL